MRYSRTLFWRRLQALFHNNYSSSSHAGVLRIFFLDLHPENWLRFLEGNTMRMWKTFGDDGPMTFSPSSSLSKLLFKCFYNFIIQRFHPLANLSHRWLDMSVSPGSRLTICPAASILWWVQEKSLFFSLSSLIFVVRTGVKISKYLTYHTLS